ncbi:hypothetical protein AJ80_02787 [Polytolypa hystricis UAMH7299]|uniref:Aminoglycoside phosphotransferase domain-containing protein n=1 Tax=Polytolypa hystricis (strain UAMH7299) TaxID=1447883 RepID=A0A2B7YPC2_POLH7|nr:hypothetical protein AJ80_02787 [Polytolypa hystricis UAMH7299]
MSSISIVYSAKPADLPRPLPTKEEIENSRDILSDQTARKVVGVVGQHFIVKYGRGLDFLEGENMLFVQKSTTVRVPRVYALYEDSTDNKKYLVVERIAGKDLASEWDMLEHEQKEAISKKLRAYWDQLRNLRSPGLYCSLNKRPLPDSIFWGDSSSDSPPINRPFENEDQLNAALGECNDEVEGGFELIVIDWEFSGWYPSYWEYSRAVFACGLWNDDWSHWVEKGLDPYLNEWTWMEMLKELWS